jgi:tetratricopeptide (TPR) repeat protein
MKRLVLCGAIALLAPRLAHAEEPAAKALFDQGKTLFAEGKYGEACAKLEASFKLAALSSTRGMLGACYEKIGRLASAWVAYRDSAAIAERQGNAERAGAAREKAAELEPRLARLTIDTAAVRTVAGIKIAIDGTEQPAAALGSELPIDAGPHVIEATAEDYKPWKSTIDIQDGERQKVVIEPLVADPTRRILIEQRVEDERRVARRRQYMAYGLIGGGGLGVGVGVTLALLARSQWHRAQDAGCTESGICPTTAGARDVDGAALKADVATYVGGVGLLLIGAGVFVYLTSPTPRTEAELKLAPSITPTAASVTLEGRF